MITADTSVWVEYLRAGPQDAPVLRPLIANPTSEIVVTEVVRMELLAGVRDDMEERAIWAALEPFPVVPLLGLEDFERAAEIWRLCRSGGETVRSLLVCLIAVAAIRVKAHLLHCDRDFEVIARHTDLRVMR